MRLKSARPTIQLGSRAGHVGAMARNVMVKIRSIARLDAALVNSLRDTLLKSGTIDPLDVDQLVVSDSPANVVAQIVEAVALRFNLRFEQAPRRRWWLFEWPARRG